MNKKNKSKKPKHIVSISYKHAQLFNAAYRITLKSIPKECKIKEYVQLTIFDTDTFFPTDADYDLDSISNNRCDTYTPITTMRKAKSEIKDILGGMIEEIQTRIEDHCGDAWNFAPEESEISKIKIKFKKTIDIIPLLKYFKFKLIDFKDKE